MAFITVWHSKGISVCILTSVLYGTGPCHSYFTYEKDATGKH